MVTFATTTSTAGLDRFLARLVPELVEGVETATNRLRPIAQDTIEAMGAVDTYALHSSLYVSTRKGSDYWTAVGDAMVKYALNPTKYPEIRAVRDSDLEVDPEAKPRYANRQIEGVLGVAAAHGKAVEEGYVSFYGNDVPARPFMAQTAEQGFEPVVEDIRRSILRAMGL